MVVGPNGGLMPAPKAEAAAPAGPPDVDPATLVGGPARQPVDMVRGDENDQSRGLSEDDRAALMMAPRSQTLPAHYVDLIGKKNWDLLDHAEQTSLEAAHQIQRRNQEQNVKDQDVAERQVVDASIRGALANDQSQAVDVQRNDLDQMHRDIQADAAALATYHENPDHFWQTRSTAQTVAGFIGIALGGFVQGVRGGENVALKQINHAIDRDIDAQRANFQAKKDSVGVKRSAYGMAMERYNHDDTKASTVVRLAMLDKIDAQAKVAAAQHAGTETDNRLNQFLADTEREKAQLGITYNKYMQKQVVQSGADMTGLYKEYGKYHDNVLEKLHAGMGGTPPLPFSAWVRGRLGGMPGVPEGAVVGPHTTPDHADRQAEADQKRTIIVDGKPRLAVNSEVVKDWNDYSHSADEARRLLKVLNDSKDGDPATYDAARAKMIEVLPQTFGYARGPSMGQIKDTFGPEAIPEYAHWYLPRLSSRADRKLLDLGKTLDTIDKSTREHTLAQSAAPTIAPSAVAPQTSTFRKMP